MNVLVIGGAGYIGSHMVRMLSNEGYGVTILDNLSTGHRQSIKDLQADDLIVGELADSMLLRHIFRDRNIEAVMHFAACALVGESVINPGKYYRNNIGSTIELLETMRESSVGKIVFSSSCATYGVPSAIPISEETPQRPVNPYGFTKLVIEKALADYASAYGFGYAALRYFNAAGASPAGDIGEHHEPETHLIPLVLQAALGVRESVKIFGTNWPTRDKTCVRDYIHVDDLCRAHLGALERLKVGTGIEVNLGTGNGFSVAEIIETCREVTGCDIPTEVAPPRPGDPPELVADAGKAKLVLDWEASYKEVKPIIETAWSWHRSHVSGYG